MLPTCRHIFAIAALGLLACGAQAAAPDPAVPEEIQGGRDLNARMTVPVTLNGAGPYHFVVDTGAERTVLSRELASRMKLAPGRGVTILSITGSEAVEAAMVSELHLNATRSRMADFEAPLLAETHLGAVGMLGLDSLKSKRVIIDFKTMHMSISDAAVSKRTQDDEIVVTARRRYGQLILVDAEAMGEKINVIIDTGSSVSIGNNALRSRLARHGKLGIIVPITITSVTGGKAIASYGIAREVRIGGVSMTDMPIAFADPEIFERLGLDRRPALLLGMDALRLFDRVSIDFANRNVRFMLKGGAWQKPTPQLAGKPSPVGG